MAQLLDQALGREETARIQERLLYFAYRWYRIKREVAEDLVQLALLAYLEVRERYPTRDEHPRIIVGIFRNKCRQYIGAHVREASHLRALKSEAEAGNLDVPGAGLEVTPEDGVLRDLVRREDALLIFEALAELRRPAREMFLLIIQEGATREDLLRHYGLNKNTLDSRLHLYRKELRRILARRGVLL